jgi:glycosyltransferase involved in cell wall biosynthesis
MSFAVSVVIPTFNSARFLAAAIDSALAQTLPPKEVIVVDDGSTDTTNEILDRYGDSIVVLRQPNSGVSHARNAGAARATGNVLAFLDSDDVWLPQKLEWQVERLQNCSVGLVHSAVRGIDEHDRVIFARRDGLSGWVARELLLLQREVIVAGSSNCIIPKAIFEGVGGFDPNLSVSADWDLWLRIARSWPVAYVPEVLVEYRYHSKSMHRDVSIMRRDMLRALGKAFADADKEFRSLRRRSYAQFHLGIAKGSFAARRYGMGTIHSVWAVLLAPSQILDLAASAGRRFRHRNRLPERDARRTTDDAA